MKDFFKNIFADKSEKIITWKIWLVLLCSFSIFALIEIILSDQIKIMFAVAEDLPILHIVQFSTTMQVFLKPLLGLFTVVILLRLYGGKKIYYNFVVYLFLYLVGIFISHIVVWFFIHPSTMSDDVLDSPWALTHICGFFVFAILGFIPNTANLKLFGKMWVINLTYYLSYVFWMLLQIFIGSSHVFLR